MEVQRLVDAYIIGLGDNADNAELCKTLVTYINSGDISLLELVQALGVYLASEEAGRRSKGVNVLSDVLVDLPADAIPAAATARLVQFFSARLADATCVPHILTATLALMRLPSFTDLFAAEILGALFKEVHVQSFQYSTRRASYQLVELALQSYPAAVTKMGDGFVLGFAQVLDGEKDPRALMLAFQIIPKIASMIDIKRHAEDLFDVIFCYFPITFKHREGDPSAVSPESLKSALRAAITCSPYFGEMAIKPLIEKTTAAAASVKVDALETLAAGALAYSPEVFKAEMEVLVEQIREDVMMAANESVVNAALTTLEAIYGVLSPSAPLTDSLPSQDAEMTDSSTPLDYVLKEAVFQLTADEIKNPDQVGKILRAVARSSSYNCSVVSDAVLPIIVERMNGTEVLTVRRELMDVLNYVLSASCDVERRAECLDADKTNLLSIYHPESSVPLDKEYSFLHIVRLKGITLLTLLPDFLSSNEADIALQTLGRAAIELNEDENVNKEATHLLIQLAQSKPEQINSTVLPMFMDALREDMVAAHKASRLLNALGSISVAASDSLLPVLQGLVSLVIAGKLASSHCVATTETIRKVIETATASTTNASVGAELYTAIVSPLVDWVHEQACANKEVPSLLVVEIARALAASFSKLDTDTQKRNLKPLFEKYAELVVGTADSSVASQYQLLPVFSAAVCSCWCETRLPVDDLDLFVSSISATALATESNTCRNVCFEVMAAVLNKTKDSKLRSRLAQRALQCAPDTKNEAALVVLHLWIARALTSCNDKGGYDSVRWLLEQIRLPSLHAAEAAQGFNIILGEHDWAVTPSTHGMFKVLAKQRFYSTVVPEITSGFQNTADIAVKTNLLVVLTNVVRHMPKSVLMNGIEKVVPLLLSAIRLTGGDLKAASIRTITLVILETPEILRDEVVTSIIPLIIASTTQSNAENTVGVRQAALGALSLIPEKYPYPVVNTVRKEVLNALARARDDRKRLVRQDAVKAFNKWLNLGDA
ncbi:hypothetical protein GGI04_001357 [Coemansia thaxteri]|uniref:MMS19 nucleotide excision repair protein n=1 Tax=Coemansia thaxteri TaxID=2663907 RepID=A0A9W8EIL6_9FUNG|nr:hypothetical protein H4R26_004011 [Coemansia thaxteri]KAJ2007877.1 hypothetical protein GGI04_001357 [Coemansia thaxteri]KAJ2483143.1 hypothetical protein EV174_003028 [Coemansia sp. RSA 2320]